MEIEIDKQALLMISELMMIVGYAQGTLESLGYYKTENWMQMQVKAKNACDTINDKVNEILKKLEGK